MKQEDYKKIIKFGYVKITNSIYVKSINNCLYIADFNDGYMYLITNINGVFYNVDMSFLTESENIDTITNFLIDFEIKTNLFTVLGSISKYDFSDTDDILIAKIYTDIVEQFTIYNMHNQISIGINYGLSKQVLHNFNTLYDIVGDNYSMLFSKQQLEFLNKYIDGK